MKTAGKMDVITDSWTSSIFSLHLLSSMYILCCLTYRGIPEYLYSISLSFLYPPDHWPCSFHWLWFQMKPATAEHIKLLSCSAGVFLFRKSLFPIILAFKTLPKKSWTRASPNTAPTPQYFLRRWFPKRVRNSCKLFGSSGKFFRRRSHAWNDVMGVIRQKWEKYACQHLAG